MGLSKKHFEAIAEILNQQLNWVKEHIEDVETKELCTLFVEYIANDLSDYFATENAQFDRKRFKEAVLKGVSE